MPGGRRGQLMESGVSGHGRRVKNCRYPLFLESSGYATWFFRKDRSALIPVFINQKKSEEGFCLFFF